MMIQEPWTDKSASYFNRMVPSGNNSGIPQQLFPSSGVYRPAGPVQVNTIVICVESEVVLLILPYSIIILIVLCIQLIGKIFWICLSVWI